MLSIENFTPDELCWLTGIAKQKDVRMVTEEVQDDIDFLDGLDG